MTQVKKHAYAKHIAEALVIEENCLSRMLLETKTELDNLNMEKGFLETALTHYQSKLDAAVAARKARTASDSDQEMGNF